MRRHRLKFIFVLFVFIVPLAMSRILFYYHEQFHFKTSNYGVLIQPPEHVAALIMKQTPTWQIVLVPVRCVDKQIDHTMFSLHQVRKALGKDRDRVSLTLMTAAPCQIPDLHDFYHAVVDPEIQHQHANNIYLVDPLGNVFMYYPSTIEPYKILKDLKHVLGASQIG